MPYNRPTPADILKRTLAEFDADPTFADPRLRASIENVLARVITMSSHELHGYISWISKQILPDTADPEIVIRHGNIWGVTRKQPTLANGQTVFSGISGTTIPQGSLLTRTDNVEYVTDEDVTLVNGQGTVLVTCVTSGTTGNADIGITLTLSNPIAGVTSEAVVSDDGSGEGITGGVDIEPISDLRTRIIERIQEPPQGGADHDYKRWAKEVAGTTRVWVYPKQLGVGTVSVAFVMDNKPDSIIPSAGEVQSVQDHIDLLRPVTADVFVFAPNPVAVDFEINLNPNNVAIQSAVKNELADFFKREAVPGGTLHLSRISEVISFAAGEFNHVLVTPDADVVMAYGDFPILGDITWGDV